MDRDDRKVNPESNEFEDFQNVQSQEEDLIREDLPEGPYGSPIVEPPGKSEPWREGQHMTSAFTYENRKLHAGNERQFPGSHPTHSEGKGEDAD
ncbi:hypothetical protein [Geomicrobium sp. JCM 19038]|uniref:hypothetical protein n=1 Tax=Geomicrobium sp. JCM 19038 TaxID=1460635 RepID=UPI00045F3BF0|nr:hypothetical protein [Geomicrobium sp. JCM 19038]GAK08541.1 hypothetical protein JCM19038_2326 [Geomicrobium sp. JCM 19038]